jgi:lincosamide nucleotidyltransferase A/C/D/E
MVSAEDVTRVYQSLLANDMQVWLTGGWGIDALLREQTRPHKDLDFIMLVDDVVRMRELLARDGFRLMKLWPENTWAVDSHGTETATAFVLHDGEGREIDAHAMWCDDQGNGVPAWAGDEGLVFKRQDLAAEGMIAGVTVQCLSPEMQVSCHSGYELPSVQSRDLQLLRARFGVECPEEDPRSRRSVR